MGAVRSCAFLAVTLVLWCCSAAANFTFPFLQPIFDNACQENVCGKGNCVRSENSSFGFECECESGWRQARAHDDEFFKFLPCVIPNCTFNYSCTSDAAPAPNAAVSHKRDNLTIFDPCFWSDCGGGSCNATSPFTRTCLCQEGYYNLFNSTAFPCYKDCSMGLDCARLGLNFTNTANSSKPNHSVADETNSNAGVGLNPGVEIGWLIIMITTWALVWMYS